MDNININLSEFGGVIAALLIVGTIFKNAFPNFPNRFIPLLTWVLGMGAYLTLTNGWHDPKQWLAAVVAAATATGTHSAIKNTVQKEDGGGVANKVPLIFLVGTLFLFAACQAPKLETGGGYHPTEATQPETVLYVTDAAYKFAYTTVQGALKFERDNRKEIAAVAPQIKPALDKLRPVVADIDLRWARAREAYQAHPTPAGLSAYQKTVAEIERLMPIVQQELEPYFTKLTAEN